MKKKISLILAISIIFSLLSVSSAFASSANYNTNASDSYIEYLDDGSYFVTEIEQNNSGISLLSSEKVGSKTTTYYSSSGKALCALKITGTFSYDGSTVSCVGTKSTKYVYDDSWSVENVTTSHGNSSSTKAYATAGGKFVNKLLGITVKSISASVTVYCDKNGNLS
jgi:hypothetical protein